MFTRTSGVLLHITSLPSAFGVGDLGPGAHAFVDQLAQAGQHIWQILPMGPTEPGLGNSPYATCSAFAGNPLWISPRLLLQDGLALEHDLEHALLPSSSTCDHATAEKAKKALLWRIFTRLENSPLDDPAFGRFLHDNAFWLNDFALFMAAKAQFGGQSWTKWPDDLRLRRQEALHRYGTDLARPILFEKFRQYLFFSQWGRLREHMRRQGIQLLGDVPIYVTHDSCDVWANPQLFKLDQDGQPSAVAGVPPDYFSSTGQRWGNPVFHWPANHAQNFAWWLARLKHTFGLCDLVRLDHFRGFCAYWEIPAKDPTATGGRWVQAPGEALLARLKQDMPHIPIIAEDLGVITPDVVALRQGFGLPGMAVLQFCFEQGMEHSPDAPHNHQCDCLAYVGTHDNNTARGWFRCNASPADIKRLEQYLGRTIKEDQVAWALIRLAMASPARTAIITAQDLLNLDETCRMNTPGQAQGDWTWRLTPGQITPLVLDKLRQVSQLFGRDNRPIGKNDSYEQSARPTGAGYQ